jgi:hypothetical protein
VVSKVVPALVSTLRVRVWLGVTTTQRVILARGRCAFSVVDQANDRYSCSFRAVYAATTCPIFTELHAESGASEETVS